jgi:hypothetical protein
MYHAINTKHVHIFVKFVHRLSIQFGRKKETQTFFQGDGSAFFCKQCFISQNWDRQPAFKFDKNLYVLCIYCMIPRNMLLDVERVHECYNKFIKSDRLEWYVPKKWIHSSKPGVLMYHAINTKHVHILVKFEHRLSIQFGRKKRHKTFSKGMAQPFFAKNNLFLKTEIDNLGPRWLLSTFHGTSIYVTCRLDIL